MKYIFLFIVIQKLNHRNVTKILIRIFLIKTIFISIVRCITICVLISDQWKFKMCNWIISVHKTSILLYNKNNLEWCYTVLQNVILTCEWQWVTNLYIIFERVLNDLNNINLYKIFYNYSCLLKIYIYIYKCLSVYDCTYMHAYKYTWQ